MAENSKVLILLTYYERPNLVRGFLRSLIATNEHHDDWELAFIDDGSDKPGKPIVERILRDHLHKVRFYNTEMTPEMKKLSGGCFFGRCMNDALSKTDAGLAIMAGDDDELNPTYLRDIVDFFQRHPDVLSTYSNVHVYNPLVEKATNTHNLYSEDPNWKGHAWFGKPIDCAYKVDGIQVAWRVRCNKVLGAWMPCPIWINHDAAYFEDLNARAGRSVYSGLIAMYKGRHDGQLIKNIQQGRGAFGEGGVIDRPKPVLFA